MNIYVYTVENKRGETDESFRSDPSFTPEPGLTKVRDYAREHNLKVIENTYVWDDSEMTDDYTADGVFMQFCDEENDISGFPYAEQDAIEVRVWLDTADNIVTVKRDHDDYGDDLWHVVTSDVVQIPDEIFSSSYDSWKSAVAPVMNLTDYNLPEDYRD